jgi:hypothetical protein
MTRKFSFDPKDDTPAQARGRALRDSGYTGPLTPDGYVDHRTDDEWLADARAQHGARDEQQRNR